MQIDADSSETYCQRVISDFDALVGKDAASKSKDLWLPLRSWVREDCVFNLHTFPVVTAPGRNQRYELGGFSCCL